jgi:hypothetical protein
MYEFNKFDKTFKILLKSLIKIETLFNYMTYSKTYFAHHLKGMILNAKCDNPKNKSEQQQSKKLK